jgi:hypothetical protein
LVPQNSKLQNPESIKVQSLKQSYSDSSQHRIR